MIGMMRKLDLPRLLSRTVSRERDLALALIASRIIAPGSKLATARALSPETASSSLGRVLDLGVIEEREIYAALDWLGEQQDRIERSLARRHLKNGALVLYDVSSSYVEGRCCELARHGYRSRGVDNGPLSGRVRLANHPLWRRTHAPHDEWIRRPDRHPR